MANRTILILGEHDPGYDVHEATRESILHAARGRAIVANTRWMGAENVVLYPGLVAEADAIVLAPDPPGRPSGVPLAVLAAIRDLRERGLPFLATGSAHALVLLEAARNLGGLPNADSAEHTPDAPVPVVHPLGRRELGEAGRHARRRVVLERIHPEIEFAAAVSQGETTDIRSGLNPDFATAVEATGLVPLLVDRHGGRPYLHVRPSIGFHAVAAFLPQLTSGVDSPHPLFAALVRAIH